MGEGQAAVTDFVLTRIPESDVTIGELKIGGHHICWMLEDPERERPGVPVADWKIKGETAIPRGRYRIERTFSNRFQYTTPQLMDVPGFSGIRIHSGNTTADTEGCLLPGLVRHDKSVGDSRLAYAEIMKWLDAIERNGDEAFVVIEGPPFNNETSQA